VATDVGSVTATQAQKFFCPLTLQEMLIVLRNVIMGAFKQSQSAAQGITPFSPPTESSNQFVPFTAASNTCYLSTTGMVLPTPIIENIRALVMRYVSYGGNAENIQYYLPILGQYQLDRLDENDYVVNVNIDGTETTLLAFKASETVWKEVTIDKDGKQLTKALAEPVISLIDGSSGTTLLAINDPAQLGILVAQWNTWLISSGAQTFSVATGVLSTELGINVLCSISMSRLWIGRAETVHPDLKRKNSLKAIQVMDSRDTRTENRALFTGPYSQRQAVVDTSQGDILDAPYSQVLSLWILPTNADEAEFNTSNSMILQRYQFVNDELRSATRTSGLQGMTLSSLHSAYAAKMTKGKTAESDDWTKFFQEMAARGRGGILSGLVAGLVGSAFPSVAGIANSIAGVIPF